MTTRLGLISDIHSSLAPLQQALDIFHSHQVDHIICAGDIAGYGQDDLQQVIDLLNQHNCTLVAGNHDSINDDSLNINSPEISSLKTFFNSLPLYQTFNFEGVSIYLVHAEPPEQIHNGIKLLDPDGNIYPERLNEWQQKLDKFDSDVLIVGHTHQVFAQQVGTTLVINPGSSEFNHSCMILTLPEKKVETFALSGKKIVPTWNWGIFYKEGGTVK